MLNPFDKADKMLLSQRCRSFPSSKTIFPCVYSTAGDRALGPFEGNHDRTQKIWRKKMRWEMMEEQEVELKAAGTGTQGEVSIILT
jgi:hypothetical protein